MTNSFEPFEFLDYLRQHLARAAVVVACAVLVAAGINLILPKKYTATASLVIEPPGGIDPRVSTAVSPVYLESLKTYEQFATSDSLFARACAKFHLLSGANAPSIESFKKRVLEVKKPKETKLLTISVTLPQPRMAHALASYLAGETVKLSTEVGGGSDKILVEQARATLNQKREELQKAQAAATSVMAENLETSLEAEVQALVKLHASLVSEGAETKAMVADYVGREAQMARSGQAGSELDFVRRELAAERAKAAAIESSRASVERDLARKSAELAKARARHETAQNRLHAAQTDFDYAMKRFAEIDAASGLRSEQLRIIDPSIVPERPSSPNLPLNCAAAFILATAGSLTYLGMRFAMDKQRARYIRKSFKVAKRDSA